LKPVKLLQSAREDIRREKAYYRKIDANLARRFQSAVEAAVKAVSARPLAMQGHEHEVRRWPLETFPHGVLYHVEDDSILVLAVFHPKQAPENWKHRIPT